MADTTIIIPKECAVFRAIRAKVHPPCSDMKIEFTLKGEKSPFNSGEIKSLRTNEIAGYLRRPIILLDSGEFTKQLQIGDIVEVKVTCYSDGTKKKMIGEKTQDVKVIPDGGKT